MGWAGQLQEAIRRLPLESCCFGYNFCRMQTTPETIPSPSEPPAPRFAFLKRFDKRQTLILLLALWLTSLALHFTFLNYPRAIIFDETYYIPLVQKYIHGRFHQESHPPLARLFMYLGQEMAFPDAAADEFVDEKKVNEKWPIDSEILGYRIAPAVFGTFLPLLLFWLVRLLTRANWMAFMAGLLVLFDNAMLVQGRAGLPDTTLIFFCLLNMVAFVLLWQREGPPDRRDALLWLWFGLSFGAALMVKFTAAFLLVLLPLALFSAWRRFGVARPIGLLALYGLAAGIMVLGVWQIHFAMIPNLVKGQEYEISERHAAILRGEEQVDVSTRYVIQLQDALRFILKWHDGVPKLKLGQPEEIGSPWYQWPFGGQAISYRWETPDGQSYRTTYLLGNAVTWLVSLIGVLAASATALSDVLFRFLKNDQRRWLYPFLLLYWGYMAGIMRIDRVMYLYHYLPPLLIGLVLFFLLFQMIETISVEGKKNILRWMTVFLLLVFYIYMPFVYYQPLTREQITQRAVWPVWQMRVAGDWITGPARSSDGK